jgi:hypothetical protein
LTDCLRREREGAGRAWRRHLPKQTRWSRRIVWCWMGVEVVAVWSGICTRAACGEREVAGTRGRIVSEGGCKGCLLETTSARDRSLAEGRHSTRRDPPYENDNRENQSPCSTSESARRSSRPRPFPTHPRFQQHTPVSTIFTMTTQLQKLRKPTRGHVAGTVVMMAGSPL